MTNSLIRPEELPLPDRPVALTSADADRIAKAHRSRARSDDPRDVRVRLAPMGALVPAAGYHRLASPTGSPCRLPRRARRIRTPLRHSRCLLLGHRARHGQEGLTDPTAHVVVRRVRRGLRRIKGVAPRRQAHPLTVAELGQIVSSIDASTAIGKRDRAVLLVEYASAMRPGEISALNTDDVLRKPTGVLLAIRRSKTDQEARGQLVGIARGEKALTDPIRALDDWLKVRPHEQGALFTRVFYRNHTTAERIGPRAISRTVQERADAAGFDGIPESGHSLRAGHATTAAVNVASIDRVAAQTLHRDLGTLLNHYIRPAEAMMTTTCRDLGL